MPEPPSPVRGCHGTGVEHLAEPDPGQGPGGHRAADRVPSDPRPGILPRGRAGWARCVPFWNKALRDLACFTGPNNASVLSSGRSP